jgi:transposase InsO family protein
VRFGFIEKEKAGYPLRILCRAIKVSRSAYYGWVERAAREPDAKGRSEALAVKESFYIHRRRYGTRRLARELKSKGMEIGRCRVRRLMREQDLRAISPKRFVPKTTDSKHERQVSPNLLKEVGSGQLSWGEAIVGDITYLPVMDGKWCYLAMFQDKVTRRIVGWKIGERMTADLVTDALRSALRRGLIKRNAIVHTDRGSQYVSNEYRELLAWTGLRQSMSARGNCYDNAQAESFFARFKTELVEGGIFETAAEARSETFSYIEGYYNRIRLHSALDYKSPMEYERELKLNERRSVRESSLSSFS